MTIVIPVYGALDETMACIYSVLVSKRSVPAHLVVIDDCTPDDETYPAIRDLSRNGTLFSAWRNDDNRGFVSTANRGILAASGDVVLLNSDTLVGDGWLDRLVACARQDDAVASVSPMTNNATILSYPKINGANRLPPDASFGDLVSLFARNDPECKPVNTPTAVGFCMLMTRDAIRAVGGFDEALFGIGYGEECDWCMRAGYLGYKHRIAVDTFVYHVGSVSFSERAAKRQELAARALAMRHPDYWHLIGQFCAADPLIEARRAVDVRRLLRGAGKRNGIVVHVLHRLGGGTQVHADQLAKLLEAEGYGSLFMKPDEVGRLRVSADFVDDLPNLVFNCAGDLPLARAMIDGLPVTRIHIHAMIGFSPEATAFLNGLPAARVMTLHDYVPLCPQITLLNETGSFCDLPSHARCNRCVKSKQPPLPCDDIGRWRQDWHAALDRAERLIAPSDFVRRAFQRVFPALAIEVVPHSRGVPRMLPAIPERHRPSHDGRQVTRVAVFGNMNHHKGIDVVVSCANQARDVDHPLQFVIFGNAGIDAAPFHGKLGTVGSYRHDELPALLAAHSCDIGFLPSIWPETYSYVLSEILELGLYPVVFDLGAQADRLRAAGFGTILPVGLGPASLNAKLLSIASEGMEPRGDIGQEERSAMTAGAPSYLESIYGHGWNRGSGPKGKDAAHAR